MLYEVITLHWSVNQLSQLFQDMTDYIDLIPNKKIIAPGAEQIEIAPLQLSAEAIGLV